jgi:hypothetical protein
MYVWGGGYAVAQLVEALFYKPESRRLDSRWRHWNFLPHHGRGVKSVFNRNEYQKYFLRCKGGQSVELTALPP